jgi:hypothetical protein
MTQMIIATSRKSKNTIEACFGEALYVPRNLHAVGVEFGSSAFFL